MQERRLAVVTGANRGIGLAITAELVRRGLRVIGTSRSADDARPIEAVGAEHHLLDVTREESVGALVADLSSGLDVLVNNAGLSMNGFDAEVARRTLDANFFGAKRVTDGLLPLLRPGARVVMVSSKMGELSCVAPALRARFESPSLDEAELVQLMESFVRDVAAKAHEARGWPSSAYSVSKVGMNALARVYARALADDPRRILVNAASPGWVRTRMGGAGAPRSVEDGARTPVWLALLGEGGPTGGFFHDERAIPF